MSLSHPDTTPPQSIAVIGLGYVGLPLAVALVRAGAGRIVGFDIDLVRVTALAVGEDRTGEVAVDDLAMALKDGLVVTGDAARLVGQDIYIVTVPTPVDATNQPDLEPLKAACQTIGNALAGPGNASPSPVIVFESTVYPGVTEEICGPAIEATSGKRSGHHFFLGYSPERINPGDRTRTVDNIAKVVAGQTPAVTERLAALYGRITNGGIFQARDIRTAEAAKAIENAQRDVNIAFINEVTMIFGRLGLSVHDVLETARTKWNFLDFQPGLVGGHCIPVDPFYLAACAQAVGHQPEVILAGRRINDGMGDYFAARISEAYGKTADTVPRTLVLGLAFKENLPDLRNSKVIDLIRGLVSRGHRVSVHDPRADPTQARAMYGLSLLGDLAKLKNDQRFDIVVGAVPHDDYRRFTAASLAGLIRADGLVADIKDIWRALALPHDIRRWRP